MILAVAESARWLAELMGLSPTLVARGLWGGLLAGMVCATVHLVTMLITRWGDGDPSSKSLMFSILVHLSCALGLVATSPPKAESKDATAEEHDRFVQQLIVDADEEVPLDETGNTPAWDRMPEPDRQEVARLDPAPPELAAETAPEREPAELLPVEPEIPEVPLRPDELAARPEPVEFAEVGPRQPAAVAIDIDDPTAEARAELRIPASSRIRRPRGRSGVQPDPAVVRDPSRGRIDRDNPLSEPARVPATLDAPGIADIDRVPADAAARRRTGPAPSRLPDDPGGTLAERATEGATGGSPAPSQFTRLRRRPVRRQPDGDPSVARSSQLPRTPSPRPGTMVAVRDGALSAAIPGRMPSVARPNLAAVNRRRDLRVPATYRLRSVERRADAARKFGGTESSERAVEAALAWLAAHQHPDGHWDANGFHAHCPKGGRCLDPAGRKLHGSEDQPAAERRAGERADSGITALALLAFLGAGHTREEGKYAGRIDRAIHSLIARQRADGYLGGNATRYARMYCHAMATFALAEAYGMQSDPTAEIRMREPLGRAVDYIVSQQNPSDGGWRYLKGQPGDISMFGWQLMALKSAEIAGITVPTATKARMIEFLNDNSVGRHNGLVAYRLGEDPTPVMTAEALFAKQMLGIARNHPASREAVTYLLGELPKQSKTNLYYWYYGTMAMFQYGGRPWQQWNESLLPVLVRTQRTRGHAAGSWDPRGPWGAMGGRIYSTAVSALCLEVYYRYLPLYQFRGDPGTE